MGNNNGQKGFIDEDAHYLNDGNTISFGQDTATIFYQEKPYFTGDKIKILKPKVKEFKKSNAQFFITSMNLAFSHFAWGSSSFNMNVLNNQAIMLPVTPNGKIDFEFMETFVAELEAHRVAELEAYLTVTGLKDYKLTEEEKETLENLSLFEWKEFNITEIFNIKNTKNILSNQIKPNSGTVPYLCASAENNSVSSYISYKEELKDKGNCIFIGGKTFVVSYQEFDFFSNDSHNLALYLRNKEFANQINQLYLATCIKKSLRHKYSWGDSISNKKIQKDKVMLPVKDGAVDYRIMARLISAVQKLVIKDLVIWADKKIEATKQVVQ